jgi:hypothetical protein
MSKALCSHCFLVLKDQLVAAFVLCHHTAP